MIRFLSRITHHASRITHHASGALATVLCLLGAAQAGEWPMYRFDAARSGYTPEALPKKLSLAWTFRPRHGPRPAWSGRDTRMPFDLAFQPVVAGGAVFFGSSADGKVTALDAATGAERWAFFTGGPVRFAPACWQGRVFVVSDDGFLYCLAAADGKVAWKLRGGPTDSLVLGNGRMVSRWPARGGPAIADGVLYWAAGIWPSEGIFIRAVDAATGKALWCNDTSGSIYMPQPHGGANARSGVSAQGYLVVAGERLLVPTGRAVPAAFRRAGGEFLYFHLQRYRALGGSGIVAMASEFVHSGGIFDTASGNRTHAGFGTATMAVTPAHVVYATPKDIFGFERATMWVRKASADRKGRKVTRRTLGKPAWRVPNPNVAPSAMIVAGGQAVAGGAGKVAVLDIASKTLVTVAEVDGRVRGLAAAGERLFVATDKGTLHCFAADPGEPRLIEPKAVSASAGPSAAADEIITKSGITEGYCLDLGCGDGALSIALARRTRLQIYAIDEDPQNVVRARAKLDDAGLYGVRVTVHQGDPARTPYPNYFADLVVSGRSVTEGAGAVPAAEMRRLLRPYGGVACIGKPGAMRRTTRGPLPGAGTWTHQYCDPANTNCSTDTVARGPLGMLWFADFNYQMPSRHGRGPAPLFHDGRLFAEGANALRAIDAYNGRKLWEYPLPGILKVYDGEHLMGAAGTGSNFCVDAQAVYLRRGGKCLKIHPATGKLLGEVEAPQQPDGKAGTWGYIAVAGDTLFGTLSDTRHIVTYRFQPGDMRTQFTESILLFAMDANTGAAKWTYRPEHSIRNNTIAIGGGRVYLIDRPMALGDRTRKRTKAEHPTGTLVALNAADGSVAWKSSKNIYGTMLALSKKHGVVLMSYQNTRFKLVSELGGRMTAFRASDGKRLWDIPANYASRPVLNGRTIYAQPGAWDLLTGAPKPAFRFSRSYGCGILAGSRNLLVYRSATMGYTDLLENHGTENYGGIRPGCWINTIPAGGLVLMPDATDRCTCSYLIKASVALQPFGLRPPTISPEGASSRTPVAVTLAHRTKGAEIRYTLDGLPPTASSRRYAGPFKLTRSATVKARAFRPGDAPSQVAAASFVIDPRVIPIGGAHWRVYDTAGAKPPRSIWKVSGSVASELSNHYKGVAANADRMVERPGTYRAFVPGKDFSDGELTIELASSDDDGLGVAFRFQAPDRHYLWAMDRQRGFHILACKAGKTYRVLAHNSGSYAMSRWYKVRVVLAGPKLTVYLDGKKDLEATDTTIRKGTFALYAWGCAGAKFRNVRWQSRTPDIRP